MDERLKKQLIFALEIDKEKEVFRQTHLSGNGRNENDAEHAWHMAIMAYLLREYASQQVDIAKVLLMCLIHDIVEIDAGDTYAYDAENLKTQKAREDAAKENAARIRILISNYRRNHSRKHKKGQYQRVTYSCPLRCHPSPINSRIRQSLISIAPTSTSILKISADAALSGGNLQGVCRGMQAEPVRNGAGQDSAPRAVRRLHRRPHRCAGSAAAFRFV